MENTNWLRQTPDKPLFPDLIWAKPENQRFAGKLLIVGGNMHGFAAPAEAYTAASKAGIGASKVLLPDKLQKTVGRAFPEAEFAPSNSSGGFSQLSLDHLLEMGDWADGVLLAGDFGRNSQTAVLLEKVVDIYEGLITVSGDGLDYFLGSKSTLLGRNHTILVINLGKLQKLAKNNRPSTPVLHNMTLHELVTVLADWTNSSPVSFITKHADNLIMAQGGRVSTTLSKTESNWQVELAAYASIWSLQNPQKLFEALTTSVFELLASQRL